MLQARKMRLPVSNFEVKIVLSISLRGSLLKPRTVKRLQDNNQAACQQTFPKVSKRLHLFSGRQIIEKRGAYASREIEICRSSASSNVPRPQPTHRDFQFPSPARVWSVIQFTSQVFPPSSENDCSKCGTFVSVFDQINRTIIILPFNVSCA